MERSTHNYYARSREGNLRLFEAAICVMKKTMLGTIVAGPFDDRVAAVAGLFVSGSKEELQEFRSRMYQEKPGDFWVSSVA